MVRVRFVVLPLVVRGLAACAQSTPAPKPVASAPVYVAPTEQHVVVRHKPKAKPAQDHAVASKSDETTMANAALAPAPNNSIPDAGE